MDGELLRGRGKGRGRPRKIDGKICTVCVRLTEEEMQEVEHFSGRFECSNSDILRRALDEFVRSRRVKT